MTFNPISEPVDFVTLAGVRSPGIAEITGFTVPLRWDERRGYGLSGATLRFRGVALSRGKLILRLVTEEHWADWETFAPLVQRPPLGERAHSLEISHPILEDLGVRSVVIESVSQPTQTADGVWTIEIALIQWQRPIVAVSTPAGATPTPEPQTEGQRIIAGLTNTLQELAAE